MKNLLCGLALALLALPASAQLQVQLGGTAGFGSSDPYSVGDAYSSVSLKLGSVLHLYSENLYALRRSRQGFSGNGVALHLDADSGYFGVGIGGYGWRGTGTRLFIGWPTGPHQTFELSYTRLKRGGSTDPVFTYGIRF
ncbi:hypothetical protein [Armatimonas sp.]|uniref:hypothetical protein n=1 Tax=Armatimonas sp. TaxID=1872638 RepID=UPI003753C525